MMLLFFLSAIFCCNAMEQAKIADRDNAKKAFIEAVRNGNYDELVATFENNCNFNIQESIDDTYEDVIGFTGYAEKAPLTALQIGIDRLSKSGWRFYGSLIYMEKKEWENALIKIIQFLLKNKADPNKAGPTEVCEEWRYSWHPLALAYRNDRYDIFCLLLYYGALLPIEDLRWIDGTVGGRSNYERVLHLFQKKSEFPTIIRKWQ